MTKISGLKKGESKGSCEGFVNLGAKGGGSKCMEFLYTGKEAEGKSIFSTSEPKDDVCDGCLDIYLYSGGICCLGLTVIDTIKIKYHLDSSQRIRTVINQPLAKIDAAHDTKY